VLTAWLTRRLRARRRLAPRKGLCVSTTVGPAVQPRHDDVYTPAGLWFQPTTPVERAVPDSPVAGSRKRASGAAISSTSSWVVQQPVDRLLLALHLGLSQPPDAHLELRLALVQFAELCVARHPVPPFGCRSQCRSSTYTSGCSENKGEFAGPARPASCGRISSSNGSANVRLGSAEPRGTIARTGIRLKSPRRPRLHSRHSRAARHRGLPLKVRRQSARHAGTKQSAEWAGTTGRGRGIITTPFTPPWHHAACGLGTGRKP
jgi:hypothetical protein